MNIVFCTQEFKLGINDIDKTIGDGSSFAPRFEHYLNNMKFAYFRRIINAWPYYHFYKMIEVRHIIQWAEVDILKSREQTDISCYKTCMLLMFIYGLHTCTCTVNKIMVNKKYAK